MHPVKAVIYDMDGLLIDSEPFWRKSEIAVFATVGLHITEQDCMETTGFRFDEVIDHWFAKHPWTAKSKEQVHDEVLDLMEQAILKEAVLFDGVAESIEYFKAKGLKLAIASSSAMRLIQACVTRLHAENVMDALISAEHEAYGKPHPAVFLKAAQVLGVPPQNCLVLEDSLNGVIAAKAAKMKCIAIPSAEDYNKEKFSIADWKVRNLEEAMSLSVFK